MENFSSLKNFDSVWQRVSPAYDSSPVTAGGNDDRAVLQYMIQKEHESLSLYIEPLSADATKRESSSWLIPYGMISRTVKLPEVRVPVLSRAITSALARRVKIFPPLKRIPRDAAPPMPPKNAIGTEITSAQGQDITRNIKARYIESSTELKPSTGKSTAKRTAHITTIGVYTLENAVI